MMWFTMNRALTDWQLDAALAYYHENGRIQAVEARHQR